MEIPAEPHPTSAWAKFMARRNQEPAKPIDLPNLTPADYIRHCLKEVVEEPTGPFDGEGDLMDSEARDRWLDCGMGMPPWKAWRFASAANEQGRLTETLSEDELLRVFNDTGDSVYDEQFDGA